MNFNIEEGRYIILGSVDGLLATLGIIIGVSIGNVGNSIVVGAALGGAIALAMTNSLGAYLAESCCGVWEAHNYGEVTAKKTGKHVYRILNEEEDHTGFGCTRSIEFHRKFDSNITIPAFNWLTTYFNCFKPYSSHSIGFLLRLHIETKLHYINN